jgi:hypothetical protein
MQHFLKAAFGAARTKIVAAELFQKLLVSVDDACAPPYSRLGGEAFATLAGEFEV